jgi:hypothetical protein
LKSNPDLLAVTDPTEDEEIDMMLGKESVEKESLYQYESTIDPLVRAALEEDLAALMKNEDQYRFMTPVKPEKDDNTDIKTEVNYQPRETKIENSNYDKLESPVKKRSKPDNMSLNIQIETSEKKNDSDQEPSERSFNDYSLQNEINLMAENLEASIERELQEENISNRDISEHNTGVKHEFEDITQDQTIEKKLTHKIKKLPEARSQLEHTPSERLHEDTTYLD